MANLEKLNNTINELETQSLALNQFVGIFEKVNDLKEKIYSSSEMLQKSEAELRLFLEKADTDINSTLSQIETSAVSAIFELDSTSKNNSAATTDIIKNELREINSTLSKIEKTSINTFSNLNDLYLKNKDEISSLLKQELLRIEKEDMFR